MFIHYASEGLYTIGWKKEKRIENKKKFKKKRQKNLDFHLVYYNTGYFIYKNHIKSNKFKITYCLVFVLKGLQSNNYKGDSLLAFHSNRGRKTFVDTMSIMCNCHFSVQ